MGPKFSEKETRVFEKCLLAAADDLIEAEKHLNKLDSRTGDGDCGSTLKRLAEGKKKNLFCFVLFFDSRGKEKKFRVKKKKSR